MGGSRGKILIIDDEELICKSLGLLLKSQGYEVQSRHIAMEGINEARTGEYDVILVDLVMPEIDGLSILKRIRDNDEQAVVIIITGYPTAGSLEEARKRGSYDYIVKPFNVERLTTLIEKAVIHRQTIQSLKEQEKD